MANLKEYLKTKFNKPDFDINDLPYEMEFKSLPQVDDGTGDGTTEDVDFENCEILDINLGENKITFVAGGDWQDPTEFTVELKDDCHFHLIEDSVDMDATFKDGLTETQIINLIK